MNKGTPNVALADSYKKWSAWADMLDDDGNPTAVDPKDIGVKIGKPLTEAEFAEYRKQKGGITVVRPPQK